MNIDLSIENETRKMIDNFFTNISYKKSFRICSFWRRCFVNKIDYDINLEPITTVTVIFISFLGSFQLQS